MATSNSVDYSATGTNIVTEALELLGVIDPGIGVSTNDQTSCLRTLNYLLKQWSGNFDFAPGLKVFNRKRGYVFLQKAQSVYSLGPSGDNATLSYVGTTFRVAGVAANTTLELTSTTGMMAADFIGIELDSGSIQWTTISSVTDADTLVIPAPGLTSAVAVGRKVFAYTTKLIRPLYIEAAVLRDTNAKDTPINPMSMMYYESLSSKTDDADPNYYLYENSLTNGKLYFDYEPLDVTKVVRITFMAPTEDIDAIANDIAMPQEWFSPVAIGLAKQVAPKFGVNWTPDKELLYKEALMIARSAYAENSEYYFQPGLE